MKADSKSYSHEENAAGSEASASGESHLSQDLRPQLNAIIGCAERLEMKLKTDEDIQKILNAARGLLDVLDRESAELRHVNYATRLKPSEQWDVLYIENDATSFASVKLLLRSKRALKVLQATDGKAGIALAQTHAPQLILLDLNLPDIHGSKVLQRLQKDPATARIPVVVISGDATPSQIERLLVLGARNYVTKPFDIEPFLTIIDDVLEENSAARTPQAFAKGT